MKHIIYNVIFLSAGTLIGSLIMKKKYQKIADKEIESIKIFYNEKIQKNEDQDTSTPKKEQILTKIGYSKEEVQNYINYARPYSGTDGAKNRIAGEPEPISHEIPITEESYAVSNGMAAGAPKKTPYLITPEEFAESFYEAKSLFYFTDKVLTDEEYNVIANVGECIGDANILHNFGLYDDSVIHVRNELQSIDYEILLDERSYKRIKTENPKRKAHTNQSSEED